jgi:hypothetical protein
LSVYNFVSQFLHIKLSIFLVIIIYYKTELLKEIVCFLSL